MAVTQVCSCRASHGVGGREGRKAFDFHAIGVSGISHWSGIASCHRQLGLPKSMTLQIRTAPLIS